MVRRIGVVAVVLISLVLGGCGATKLVKRWDDETYTGGPLKKMIVIGVFDHEVTRAYFENEFVTGMKNKDAVQSFTLMPDLQDLESKDAIIKMVKEAQADSILVVRVVGKNEKDYYIPGRVQWIPNVYANTYNYYGRAYRARYLPAFNQYEKTFTLETRVYALSTEKLVWAGRTSVMNPRSAEAGIRSLAKNVTKDMRKTGIME
jgi:hypothetical protein